ncbi:MAG: hypothetical protein DYG98_15865 [Haliscomenobacteraceae bacterium CHB4]|nr:hypothetical protein [Saprospiraceae bacterium]MCE7924523.1 hypothetical protein [Haliscomenobacteraceae bacterium CHB4]
MPTFTFITDYRGGTYICQKAAADLRTACFLWKNEIVSGRYVQHLDIEAFSKAFDADIDELPPLPIDEVSNVWLFHLMFGRYMLDLHIVQTETAASKVRAKTMGAVA